jgi:tetratricopeptide (TPR) repeat protein
MPGASPSLTPVTLNNLSIYYTRTGQPNKALRCLLRVVKQSKQPTSSHDSVSVHAALNLTSVLADLGRHREALHMAQQAVRTLPRGADGKTAVDPSLLCAAYHNLAVQQERLGATAGHMQSYRAALAQVRRSGDEDNQMAQFIQKAYDEAMARQSAQKHPRATLKPPASK